jgi:hypothetical protein
MADMKKSNDKKENTFAMETFIKDHRDLLLLEKISTKDMTVKKVDGRISEISRIKDGEVLYFIDDR